MNSKAVKKTNTVDDLVRGCHGNPFAVLGIHRVKGERLIRTLQPHATAVSLLDRQGNTLGAMKRIHEDGLFAMKLPPRISRYRLRLELHSGGFTVIEDPYRFPSTLGSVDLYLLTEGLHQQIYKKLGAHETSLLGVKGTCFAVWAPNALRVSVVGDFNDWDGRRHVMRLHPGNGIWEIFLPGVLAGSRYKYELLDADGKLLPLKTDPLAHYFEPPPGNASFVYTSRYQWADSNWMTARDPVMQYDQPVSIYETHLGSWRRRSESGNRPLSYCELAEELVSYVVDMGFTHIELLPVTEHPFDGSWGYQPVGIYAPTQRFGEPDDFRHFIDSCHQAGLAVILDWVPAHFPRDQHGLSRFDGTALYEHEDPRKGEHADWGTLIFNYGGREVTNYLIGSALYWLDEFHIDGLRVDAVASMLYLDYSREAGEWLPNEHGGNENLEAVEFIRRLTTAVAARGGSCFAEESTTWPGVSKPVNEGGLGFKYKWNLGWMNDSLKYMSEEPVHRKHHHDKMTFGLVYAYSEHFVLPLSHDEVVHGKRSLLGRMPGDPWQRFANLRAYYGFMFAHPGKKLLFMGAELAQEREWNHDRQLDWQLLEQPNHAGVQRLVQDLNRTYRASAALYQQDHIEAGFTWIDCEDRDQSVFSWERHAADGSFIICISNFTPVVREDYRLKVPFSGSYRELINTDMTQYGGSGITNPGNYQSQPGADAGQGEIIMLTLPPLSTLMLQPA